MLRHICRLVACVTLSACGGSAPPARPPASPAPQPACANGDAATGMRVRAIATAVTRWRMVNDGCPAGAEALVAGGALPNVDVATDGYGRAISFRCDERTSTAVSAGCDGLAGTADDVSASESFGGRYVPPPRPREAITGPEGDPAVAEAKKLEERARADYDERQAAVTPGLRACFDQAVAADPSLVKAPIVKLGPAAVQYDDSDRATDVRLAANLPPGLAACASRVLLDLARSRPRPPGDRPASGWVDWPSLAWIRQD